MVSTWLNLFCFQRKINRFSVRVLLKFKSANNLVLLADATPSAGHFSPAETKGSFGGDFHCRLNPRNFVCYSRKGWRIPLMDGSTTAWAVLFTDGTLKRRGFHKFSSITYGWTQAAVTHLFSFADYHKWKQICILHFASSPTVHKWFCHTVPSGLPCSQVRSRTSLFS